MINTSGGNVFGTRFRVTTFGESHGAALGAIIDGAPSCVPIDIEEIQKAIDARKPNTLAGGTPRAEADKVEILSGVFDGVTTGCPIALLIRNENQKSSDYEKLKDIYRPGHADYTFDKKFGVRDYRGGGRSSGRETVARVAAGAVAKAVVRSMAPEASVTAYTKRVAGVEKSAFDAGVDYALVAKNLMKAADKETSDKMILEIEKVKAAGDSIGGIVECIAQGFGVGLGRPVFDKAQALIAHAIFSIGAIKGLEFGQGFAVADLLGSEDNDAMRAVGGEVQFLSNNAGGLLGGITRGDDIIFRAAVKAVPSVKIAQETVQKVVAPDGSKSFSNTTITVTGRHDTCLCPRIASVIEAMTWIVGADLML